MNYTIILTKDEDGGYDANVPSLPGCRTWGATKREAKKNILEAIEAYIESLRIEGDPIPEEAGSFPVHVTI